MISRVMQKMLVMVSGLVLMWHPGLSQAAEKTGEKIEQEAIKARTVLWREAEPDPENPSSLLLETGFPDPQWWEQFQDPHLTRCIQAAIKSNLSLAMAHTRIEEARAMARQSLGREFPQVGLGATFNRSRNSATIFRSGRFGSGSQSNASGSGSGGGGFVLGQFINFWSVPMTVSYEADIWGKNRDKTKAAKKEAEAVQRDFQSVQVILATDVANAYFNLLTADELISLQRDLIAAVETDLAHAQRRYEAGLTDEEEVVLRQGRLTDFRAQLQDYYQLQALALNQLAVLMGQTPHQVENLERQRWGHYRIPAEITAGVPSDLLTRRPDILAAEARLQESGLLVRAARKEMLPSITLNGQFGFASASFADLSDWDSYIASLGGSLAQGLFTGGQARANLRVFKARYEQQLLSYRNAILEAFREVDDSLASLKAHRNAYQEYAGSLSSLSVREQIQTNRLEAGAISEADIMPVRIEVIQARQGLARTKLSAMSDVLSLYKALGGGY